MQELQWLIGKNILLTFRISRFEFSLLSTLFAVQSDWHCCLEGLFLYTVLPLSLQLNGFVDRYSETLVTAIGKEPLGKYPLYMSTQ